MARSKRVGVLWLREKQMDDGSTLKYFSGYIDNGIHGDIPIAVFKTREKPGENSPDYHIVMSEPAPEAAQPIDQDDEIPY